MQSGVMASSHEPVHGHGHPVAPHWDASNLLFCFLIFFLNIFKVCPKEGRSGPWLAEDGSEHSHARTAACSRLAAESIFFSNSFLLKK